jgi:hypothetical protein
VVDGGEDLRREGQGIPRDNREGPDKEDLMEGR